MKTRKKIFFYFGNTTFVVEDDISAKVIYKNINSEEFKHSEALQAIIECPDNMEVDLEIIKNMEHMMNSTDPKDKELISTWLVEKTEGLFKPMTNVG